ncbi:hypothetical protein [Streptomyces sp. NPDC005435]|uniref:hypothetical protein n=1 Tax=Streptomyces sp. NPDC005435 TaxID=3154464 RepID=UPI0034553ECA
MSGNSYHYGDSVTIHGGQGHQGIVKTRIGTDASGRLDPAVIAALAELHAQILELRAQPQILRSSAALLDEALPAVSHTTPVPPQERHRALMAIAGVAATVGAVGQPVAQAVRAVIGMPGG